MATETDLISSPSRHRLHPTQQVKQDTSSTADLSWWKVIDSQILEKMKRHPAGSSCELTQCNVAKMAETCCKQTKKVKSADSCSHKYIYIYIHIITTYTVTIHIFIFICELRTKSGKWRRVSFWVSFLGGPLSVLQLWQPTDPVNTTLVYFGHNFVRYSYGKNKISHLIFTKKTHSTKRHPI